MKQSVKANSLGNSKEKKPPVSCERKVDQQWSEFDAEVGTMVDERLTSERLNKEWDLWSGRETPGTVEENPKRRRLRRT